MVKRAGLDAPGQLRTRDDRTLMEAIKVYTLVVRTVQYTILGGGSD